MAGSATNRRGRAGHGTFSLTADLGLGQPMDHVGRSCVLAGWLAEHIDLDERTRASLYYVKLLDWVGCIADSYEVARIFGDDVGHRPGVYDVDMQPLECPIPSGTNSIH